MSFGVRETKFAQLFKMEQVHLNESDRVLKRFSVHAFLFSMLGMTVLCYGISFGKRPPSSSGHSPAQHLFTTRENGMLYMSPRASHPVVSCPLSARSSHRLRLTRSVPRLHQAQASRGPCCTANGA